MQQTNSGARSRALALGLVAALALSGCGGGGGGEGAADSPAIESLGISLVYVEPYLALFASQRFSPSREELKGYAVQCQLQDGRLPAGVTLARDCSIGGTATSPADADTLHTITARVTVPGYSGFLDQTITFSVYTPQFFYEREQPMPWGETFADSPLWFESTPDPSATTYSKGGGDWPDWLQLDTVTGQVTAIPQTNAAATGRADVVARVRHGDAFVDIPGQFNFSVTAPEVSYPDEVVDVGNRMTATPVLPTAMGDGSYTLAFAITGTTGCAALGDLTVESATGIVTGRLNAAIDTCTITLDWRATKGTVDAAGSATLRVTD